VMGRQRVDQSQLFYLFNLEGRIPAPLRDRLKAPSEQRLGSTRGRE
jgi:hypothetical protein